MNKCFKKSKIQLQIPIITIKILSVVHGLFHHYFWMKNIQKKIREIEFISIHILPQNHHYLRIFSINFFSCLCIRSLCRWLPILETTKSKPPHTINGQTQTNYRDYNEDGDNVIFCLKKIFFIFNIVSVVQIFGIICHLLNVFFRETENNFGHLFWFLDFIIFVKMGLAFQSFFSMRFKWSVGYGLGPRIAGFIFDFG